MRLCHIVPSLEERHGGPSKSVRAVADAQAALGAEVDLLATQTPPAVPVTAGPVTAGPGLARNLNFDRQWPQRLYRSTGLREHLRASRYGCIHSHALWVLTVHYAASTAGEQGVPLVLSPRGMLTEWAYRHHRGRKLLARCVVHPRAFLRAAGWHATSQEEADDIRRLGFTQPVCVAPNGVVLPEPGALATAEAAWRDVAAAAGSRRIALFYSRFHRKKRLRELIDLWLATSREGWYLLLVGLPEEFSLEEVSGWIAAAGAQDRVGVLSGAGRPPPYAIASLFLLPSHSENFGLVIAEALAAGVPVLATDTTPWRGLDREQAGWCVAWPDYPSALAAALALPAEDLRARGELGRSWVARDFTWASSARRLLDFYGELQP